MVSARDRGQLILIGAILLATVIFGLSLLLNSALFTGSSGGSGADAALAETDLADFEVQRGARELIVRVNQAERNVTWSSLGTVVGDNVTRFGRLLAESKAAAGSVAVNVTYDHGSSRQGYRIVQAHDADFTDNSDFDDWTPVSDPDTNVSWFTANLNVENTSSSTPFVVTADNGSHDVRIELLRSASNVTVTATAPNGSTSSPTCGSAGGRVLLDLYRGSGFADDCEFTGIGALDGSTRIEFENGDDIEGKYEIVMDRSNSLATGAADECVDAFGNPEPPDEADPCVAPVVWSANLTTTVHGDGVSYETSRNLTIYAEAS